ncbi:MAG: hypothetical protein DRP63_05540 [Planctomycetota bacterium]|nr:MAG: hypothetical protein DRP63_05540 [Planctomycetota bacterium]
MKDEELIERAVGGDEEAFRELFKRYANLAGAVAYSVLGEYGAAQDVVQETFFRLWRLLPRLREPNRVRQLVAKTARSVSLDVLRRRSAAKRAPTIPFSSLQTDEEQPVQVPTEAPPSDALLRKEIIDALMREVDSLPEAYREVVALRYISELSCQEIAELLETTVSAVEARLHRAREHLRRRLERIIGGSS